MAVGAQVCLILEHDDDGSRGVVLNRPMAKGFSTESAALVLGGEECLRSVLKNVRAAFLRDMSPSSRCLFTLDPPDTHTHAQTTRVHTVASVSFTTNPRALCMFFF